MATKKVSLATIAEQIAKMDARMERGFAAVAGDIADIKHNMVSMGSELSPNVGFQFSLVWRDEVASVISRCLDRRSSLLAGDRAVSASAG